MPKSLALLSFLALAASLPAQTKVPIPTACLRLKAPTAEQRASIAATNTVFEQVIKKDALDLDKLRKAAQQDVDQHPNDPFYLGLLGNIEFRAGDLETAIATLNRSMEILPCINYVQFTAAKYYALMGSTDAAQQHLDFAYALSPNIPEIASAWKNTRAARTPARRTPGELQRRTATPGKANSVEPFGDSAEPFVLPPAMHAMTFYLHKPGPPSLGDYAEWDLSTIVLLVNGKPMNLVLNLGDSGLNLTPDAAKRAGIPGLPAPRGKARTIRVETPASPLNIPGAFSVRSATHTLTIPPTPAFHSTAAVQLGDMQSPDIPLTVNMSENRDDIPVDWTDGTIGLYAFSRSLITLDIWNGTLTLSPLPPEPPSPATDPGPRWTTLYVVPHKHQLVVPVDIGYGAPHLFLLNMGSSDSIAPDAARKSPDFTQYLGNSGTGGIDFMRVKLGGKTLAFSPGLAQERQIPNLGMGLSGVLGRNSLQGTTLTLDYRDHLIKAN